MRAFRPYSLIALFVALNNSFKDHIIGSRLFRFHPEHLRTTYVRAEADDWPTLRLHTTWLHRRKQLKHNKIILQTGFVFIIQGKGNMNTFIQIQCPTNIVLPQGETPPGDPQNTVRVALWPPRRRPSSPTTSCNGRRPCARLQCRPST